MRQIVDEKDTLGEEAENILLHTLGARDDGTTESSSAKLGWRNNYAIEVPCAPMQALVDAGYMEFRGEPSWTGGLKYFAATALGIRLANHLAQYRQALGKFEDAKRKLNVAANRLEAKRSQMIAGRA